MILDLERFVAQERPHWDAFEAMLDRLGREAEYVMPLAESQRFYYLYRRAASGLEQLRTFSAESALHGYLEGLVARGYMHIHETRSTPHRLHPMRFARETFPRCFRRHWRAFAVTVIATLLGCFFGGGAIYFDDGAKASLLPFGHGSMNPQERVSADEEEGGEHLKGHKSGFAAMLMTHNMQVSIVTMGLGITWGLGSIIMLFVNGVILGGIIVDYMRAGESLFLAGWLLPHGSVEIPAILVAAQAGLLIGSAMIGWESSQTMRERLRGVMPDALTLMGGVAMLLVWAGIVEAFFSQYHEPMVPYALKIAFGVMQCAALALYLSRSGLEAAGEAEQHG